MVMMFKKIIFAANSKAFSLKETLKAWAQSQHIAFEDIGAQNEEDPKTVAGLAQEMAEKLKNSSDTCGVALCGSGLGMSIEMNRYPVIRAAFCNEPKFAKIARARQEANVLVLSGKLMPEERAIETLALFLNTSSERDVPQKQA